MQCGKEERAPQIEAHKHVQRAWEWKEDGGGAGAVRRPSCCSSSRVGKNALEGAGALESNREDFSPFCLALNSHAGRLERSMRCLRPSPWCVVSPPSPLPLLLIPANFVVLAVAISEG